MTKGSLKRSVVAGGRFCRYQGHGRRPTSVNFGLRSEFAFLNSRSRSWASAHTGELWAAAQTRVKARSRSGLNNPSFFNCALSLNRDGRVSGSKVIAVKCHRSAIPGCGFEPTVKTLSRHRLAGDILNTAEASLNSKPKIQKRIQKPALFSLLKKSGPRSKRRRGRGAKPRGYLRGLKPELRGPRSGGVCGYNRGT